MINKEMSSRHCDPNKISLVRSLGRCSLKTNSKSSSSWAASNAPGSSVGATLEKSGTSGDPKGLLVTRELYKVLDQERRKRASSTRSAAVRGKGSCGGRLSHPNFIICYLCGLKFSAGSLPIHQPQCYVKKLIEWERMDPSIRGRKPVDPETHEQLVKEGFTEAFENAPGSGGKRKSEKLDWLNSMHFNEFKNTMLLACDNCGRKFLPGPLEVHKRSCKPGAASASKPVSRVLESLAKPQKAAASLHGCSRRRPGSETHTVMSIDEKSIRPAAAANKGLPEDVGGILSFCEAPSAVADGVEGARVNFTDQVVGADSHADEILTNGELAIDIEASEIKEPYIVSCMPIAVESKNITRSKNTGSVNAQHLVKNSAIAKKKDENLTNFDSCEAKGRATTMRMAPCMGVDKLICELPAKAMEESYTLNDGALQEKRTPRIPMNNVSRFKNVPSRLHVERQNKGELPRCCYCNRTFNPDRLAKHESVCLERKNPTKATSNSLNIITKSKEKKTNTWDEQLEKRVAVCEKKVLRAPNKRHSQQGRSLPSEEKEKEEETPQTTGVAAAIPASFDQPDTLVTLFSQGSKDAEKKKDDLSVRHQFCFDCGTKLRCASQRFCSECGARLQ